MLLRPAASAVAEEWLGQGGELLCDDFNRVPLACWRRAQGGEHALTADNERVRRAASSMGDGEDVLGLIPWSLDQSPCERGSGVDKVAHVAGRAKGRTDGADRLRLGAA